MIRAILDGAMQIAVPAFVSTLCICIVFVPIFFLSGTAKYLFQPLAMAVIFAMLASYFLSRTVVPTMVKFLMGGHLEEIDTSLAQGLEENETAGDKIDNEWSEKSDRQSDGAKGFLEKIVGFLKSIHETFNRGFDKVRDFFPAPPFDPATVTDSAKTLDYPDHRRVAVAEILERQNKNWGADEKTLANIERLRSGAHAIVTGHQASLFGGPLFSLLKAISIAKIAAETTARGIPTVPIH